MQSTACSSMTASDQQLIAMALSGDQSGYTGLVARYQDRLYTSIRNNVGCPVLAEDIVQDALAKAFVHLNSFRSDSNFYTWLYRIALNSRRKYFGKNRAAVSLDAINERQRQDCVKKFDSVDDHVERREERVQVRQALSRLAENHREILILREFEGFDYDTIAEVLHVKPGTVRSRLSRARASLKVELTEYIRAKPKSESVIRIHADIAENAV